MYMGIYLAKFILNRYSLMKRNARYENPVCTWLFRKSNATCLKVIQDLQIKFNVALSNQITPQQILNSCIVLSYMYNRCTQMNPY